MIRPHSWLLLVMVLSKTLCWRSSIALRTTTTTAFRGLHGSEGIHVATRPGGDDDDGVSIVGIPVCDATTERANEWKRFYRGGVVGRPNRKPCDVQYEMRSSSSQLLLGTVRVRPCEDGWHLVRGLLVDPEQRHKGYATRLLDGARRGIPDDAHQNNTPRRLFCVADESLAPFYERCGFVRTPADDDRVPAWMRAQHAALWWKNPRMALFLQPPPGSAGAPPGPSPGVVRVWILQHHLEPKRPTATAPLLDDVPGLDVTRFVWRGRIDNEAVTNHLERLSSSGAVLLWVGGSSDEWESDRTPGETADTPVFVVLDGTWQEAKAMFRKIPLLPTLPRWTLRPEQPSRYALRKDFSGYRERMGQGTTGVLCTAEVVAEILEQRGDERAEAGTRIRDKLETFQEEYRTAGPRAALPPTQNNDEP